MDAGFDTFKLFPAAQAGGMAMLKAMGGPFPQARFCPTGGIDAASAPAFLALPNVACVGGSWLCPAELVRAGNWDAITALARAAAALRPARKQGLNTVTTQPAAVRQLGFDVSRERFRGIDALRLADRAGSTEAVFALQGATLLDWRCAPPTACSNSSTAISPRQSSAASMGCRTDGALPGTASRTRVTASTASTTTSCPVPGRCAADLPDLSHARSTSCPCTSRKAPGASVLFGCEAIRPGVFAGYPSPSRCG